MSVVVHSTVAAMPQKYVKIRMSVACGRFMHLLCSHDVREARRGIPS